MKLQTVAILSPGDMGYAFGRYLRSAGRRVVTTLEGRTALTRERAERAGFEDLASLERVFEESDLVVSILPPSEALGLALRFAEWAATLSSPPAFVDCNAVSPATAERMDTAMGPTGAVFIDGGIIGAPPGRGPRATRLYLSGPHALELEALQEPPAEGRDEPEVLVRVVGDRIGQASGLKMVYAGLTKGTMTLHAAVLVAAQRLGLYAELIRELGESQEQALARMGVIPFLPADAGRWIGEMEEISATFSEVGVTSGFHDGAAAIFRAMAATPFAEETRESLDRTRTLEDMIRVLAKGGVG